MKKIKEHKVLLFDLDNTILDFSKAEDYSIRALALDYHINLEDSDVLNYVRINEKYWDMSDKGQIKKDEMLKRRFVDFFKLFNLEVDGKECDEKYRYHLTEKAFLVDGALEVLEELSIDHDLYIVSNGVKQTQEIRMKKAGINKYFKKTFLSDEIGYSKPNKEFFDFVKEYLYKTYCDDYTLDDVVLIGDNLFTDINGANCAQIKSVYFNIFNKENNTMYKPIYEIKKLREILED